jgi:hypothetical protein
VNYLEALLPKPEPVSDPRILASAIAGLFAEFLHLPLEEQYKLTRRLFVAFEVTEEGASKHPLCGRSGLIARRSRKCVRNAGQGCG